MALLFRNHDDLLREFTYFLPDNTPPLGGGGGRGGRGGLPVKKGPGAGYKAGRKAPPPLRKGEPRGLRWELGCRRCTVVSVAAKFVGCLERSA